MLQSYHLMKISRSIGADQDKNDHVPRSKRKSNKNKNRFLKCRVCLNEAGEVPIYADDNSFNTAEALLLCADIDVQTGDSYPQHLCLTCHESLKKAFQFRTLAKQSETILKTTSTIKEEYCEEVKPIKTRKSALEDKDNDIEMHCEVIEPESLYSKRRVKCKLCGKIVGGLYFKSHFKSMHEKLHERAHICDICGKAFRQLGSLSIHKKQHTNEFPFLCNSCPFRARYKNLLDIHMRRHSGEKKFMCTECPARFYTGGNLAKHMRTHKDPAFKCDICSRPYRSKENLKRHFDCEHLGIRQKFSCRMCGNEYTLKQQLYRHEIRKHGRQKSAYSRMPSYLVAQKDSTEENV